MIGDNRRRQQRRNPKMSGAIRGAHCAVSVRKRARLDKTTSASVLEVMRRNGLPVSRPTANRRTGPRCRSGCGVQSRRLRQCRSGSDLKVGCRCLSLRTCKLSPGLGQIVLAHHAVVLSNVFRRCNSCQNQEFQSKIVIVLCALSVVSHSLSPAYLSPHVSSPVPRGYILNHL